MAYLTDWLVKDLPPKDYSLSDHSRLIHEVRPCDILLVEGRARVSEVIKQITQSTWSHAALYIGRLHNIENPVLRQRVSEFRKVEADEQLIVESLLGQGTIISPLSNYKLDHLRICRPQGLTHRDKQLVIGYALGRLGLQYDVRQLLDLARYLLPWGILPRRWRSSLFEHKIGSATREICSALLAESFFSINYPILPLIQKNPKTGVEFIPRNPKLFTPSDFDYSPYFDIVKYPMFDLTAEAAYKHLPWSKERQFHDDDGQLPPKPNVKAAPSANDKSMQEPPETD